MFISQKVLRGLSEWWTAPELRSVSPDFPMIRLGRGKPSRLDAMEKKRRKSGWTPHQGKRECARRVRQMAEGRIKP